MDNDKNKPFTLIDRINNLLNNGKTIAALELAIKNKQKNPQIENAQAVCLMRLEKFEEAVSLLTPIVFQGRIVGAAIGTPVIYITNLVTAMLKVNNVSGALYLFQRIEQQDRSHPAVVKLERSIKNWKQNLSILGKFLLVLGAPPINL